VKRNIEKISKISKCLLSKMNKKKEIVIERKQNSKKKSQNVTICKETDRQ